MGITTSAVVEAIDRCQVSSQQAMMVISPCLAAVVTDSKSVILSQSTINRRRSNHRISIEENIHNTFESVDTLLTVHFDTKRMKDNTEHAAGQEVNVETLAIVVSSIRGCKLLANPKIENGKGQTIADCVFNILGEWNLKANVRALCFDTSSSNTGKLSGSTTILEKMLPSPILFCACRHHIGELLLRKAFELTIEPHTVAPTIGIFQKFQNYLPHINVDFIKIKKNSAINNKKIQQQFEIEFARQQMDAHHDRADYRELAHLMLLFLGETATDGGGKSIKIKAPGAVSTLKDLFPFDTVSSIEIQSSSASEFEESKQQPAKKKKNLEKKMGITTSAVVEAIDRCQVSSQQAMMVISPCLAAVVTDSKSVILSQSTINRRRSNHRISIEENIHNTFESVDTLLTVHFDTKRMKDNTEHAAGQEVNVETLAIVVSSIRGCKLLAIPKIENGKGQTIADCVFNILGEWNLKANVRALCFDTSSSNTGKLSGSTTILEKMLPSPILFCACRHHIGELLLRKAFELTIEPHTVAPTIGIFQKFQNYLPHINVDFIKIKKNSAINNKKIQQQFEIEFARQQMDAHHDRADYRELAHLMLLFLGETATDGGGKSIKIKAPGEVSRVRFMGKAIYELKMCLFRDQFDLKDKDLKGLQNVNIFIAIVYIPYWYSCTFSVAAPMLDLKLIENLLDYKFEVCVERSLRRHSHPPQPTEGASSPMTQGQRRHCRPVHSGEHDNDHINSATESNNYQPKYTKIT